MKRKANSKDLYRVIVASGNGKTVAVVFTQPASYGATM